MMKNLSKGILLLRIYFASCGVKVSVDFLLTRYRQTRFFIFPTPCLHHDNKVSSLHVLKVTIILLYVRYFMGYYFIRQLSLVV